MDNEIIVKEERLDLVVSPPDNLILYFFCSSLIDFEISLRFFLLKCFLLPLADIKIYFGLTPLQTKSDIDDLIIFFINSAGFLKFR